MFEGAGAPIRGGGATRTMRGATRALAIATAIALAASASCAPAFDGHTYRGPGFAFEVPATPVEWRAIDVSGAALAYEIEASGGSVLVSGRCDRDGEDVPLRALVQHLFLRFTEREIHDERTETFDGREAMRVELSAKLDGVERRFVAWVLKKDGCVYDLLLAAPPESFARLAPAFDAWARGFHAQPRDLAR
jgi:hypothetical protein